MTSSITSALLQAAGQRDRILDCARRLIAVQSPNPPGDTHAVAAMAAELIRALAPSAAVNLYRISETVGNLVAVVRGTGPGRQPERRPGEQTARRLVLSGHLDTYPLGDAAGWTVAPFAGEVRDGRLYGRGAADMKGGIAASIVALAALATHADAWPGEAVLALAGDEESMGTLGTQWLLENVPAARGDAVIIGDAGSPLVLRFGEKGFLWVRVMARGKPAHGAHVHLGVNALDRLRAALDAVAELRALHAPPPPGVAEAIAAAKQVSETLGGAGEAEVLGSVTVNLGRIAGGSSPNLVPAMAEAALDIRLPAGVSAAAAEAALAAAVAGHAGVTFEVLRRFEPTVTEPAAEIVQRVRSAAEQVLGRAPAVNMRVGGSDARLFRRAGIPTVVYGPTPFNMGGVDEYVLLDDLEVVARVHALAAFDFLNG
jgi:acetylornithine deacetylase/succinyl-diaminopimelate desuccinylase-like protein